MRSFAAENKETSRYREAIASSLALAFRRIQLSASFFGVASFAAFGAGAHHYADMASLTAALATDLAAGAAPTVLVKGSRSMRMERVVRALDPHDNDPLAGAH